MRKCLIDMKAIRFLSVLALLLTLVSCSGKETPAPEKVTKNQTVSVQQNISYSDSDIDTDLSPLDANMAYAALVDISSSAYDHEGEVIRITGKFSWYTDESTGEKQYGCVVSDATACCTQGIYFVPADSGFLPEKALKENQEITVTGKFDVAQGSNYEYYRLVNSVIS